MGTARLEHAAPAARSPPAAARRARSGPAWSVRGCRRDGTGRAGWPRSRSPPRATRRRPGSRAPRRRRGPGPRAANAAWSRTLPVDAQAVGLAAGRMGRRTRSPAMRRAVQRSGERWSWPARARRGPRRPGRHRRRTTRRRLPDEHRAGAVDDRAARDQGPDALLRRLGAKLREPRPHQIPDPRAHPAESARAITVVPWRVKPPIAASSAPASSSATVAPISRAGSSVPRGDRVEQRGVVAHGHPVHAGELELVRDHAAHRNRDAALVAEHQADLDVAAVLAQRADGRGARARAAERVERHVRAAGGGLEHRRGRLAAARVDRHLGPELARERQLGWVDVDRRHARAGRRGDHHGREPDAAAAVHGDPVALPRPAVDRHRRVGGHEAAAERRRRDEAERVRQADEVQVGVRQRHVLRERAGPGEARLVVEVADLRLPRQAGRAAPAAEAERAR